MKHIITLLKKKSSFSLQAEGISMLPLLWPGDTVYYRKIRFGRLKINDVVIAIKSNRIFIHRVIYKKGNYVVTKGDNNMESDGKIYNRQIVGSVYQFKRQGRIIHLDSLYLLQSSYYFEELVKLNRKFEKGKINFLYLKGLPLHLYIEKSHPKRIYADTDILIDKKSWKETLNILEKDGFSQAETSLSTLHKILKNKETEVLYYKTTGSITISLDVHLEAGFLFSQLGRLDELYSQRYLESMMNEFIITKQYISIQKIKFPILSNEWMIIYLSLHFYHHNFRGAFRLELIDKVINKVLKADKESVVRNKEKNIWNNMSKKITKYRLQNFVYPVFSLAKKYFNTTIPETFFSSIKPDGYKFRYIQKNIINAKIFNDESRISAGVNKFKNLFFLSHTPILRKLLVISNLEVIYSVFWVMIFFSKRFFRKVSR